MIAQLAVLELHRLSWRRARRGVEAIASEFGKYDLLTYSSAIAFQVLYAVIPLVFLALGMMGVVGVQSLYTGHIAPTLEHTLSKDAFAIANRTALKAMGSKRVWWSSVGAVVTLWGVGASLRAMMTPLNNIYGARDTRSWGRRLVESVAGGAGIVVCIYGAIVLVLTGRLVHPGSLAAVPFFMVRWLGALVLLFLSIAILLRVVPAKARPMEWVSIGSTLCVVCWIAATVGFGAYITAVSYSSFYGAVASGVILLIYLHVAAIAFLLGVVVDALLREEISHAEAAARGRRRRGRARTRVGT